jgi:hypothetical protein
LAEAKIGRILAAVLAAATLLALTACSPGKKPEEAMPDTLAGLDRIRLITGQEAIDRVNDLHGEPLDVERCAIGMYGEDDQSATVWISSPKKPNDARDQAMRMINSMQNKAGPFEGPEKLTSHGIDIYKFTGMGQEHFVFTKDDLAFWISTPPDYGTKALQEFF